MHHSLPLLIALLVIPSLSAAAPNEQWRTTSPSLAGLNGVYVTVRYDAPVHTEYGLSEADLRTALELRLKANDIRILTEEEWAKTDRRPYLCLTIKGSKVTTNQGNPDFLFAWGLDLIQTVKMLDAPDTESTAITWTQEYSAVIPERNLRTISVMVSDVALEFANALKATKKGES